MQFSHQKLEVYQYSLTFILLAENVIEAFPPGRSYLTDQLRRAALSISCNITEGYGEFSPKDKARFYRYARRSATECAACLDVCRQLGLAPEEKIERGEAVLASVVRMMTVLIKRHSVDE